MPIRINSVLSSLALIKLVFDHPPPRIPYTRLHRGTRSSAVPTQLYYSFSLKRVANAQEMEKKDLMSELEVMKTLKPHPHVIKLLGCVTISGNSDLYSSFLDIT